MTAGFPYFLYLITPQQFLPFVFQCFSQFDLDKGSGDENDLRFVCPRDRAGFF